MHALRRVLFVCMILTLVPSAWAQRAPRARGGASSKSSSNGFASRLMQLDSNQDGKLTKDEVTDERLLRAFDLADSNQDGTVTKTELNSFAAKERSNGRNGRQGAGGGFPPGGGGPGMGPRGPRPKPGEVLPQMLQERLNLTTDQQAQLKELQKEVDAKLAKILTSEQKAQLEDMQNQGPPGGFGGPPPGGFGPPPGGFGGGPPGGDFGGGAQEDGAPFPPPDF